MVLAALGIRAGNPNKELTPKTTFTRGAAATLLAKAYNTPATWEQLGEIYVSPFVDHVGDYGNGDAWAYALGFMSGTGSAGGQLYFSPKRDISVIEFTGMLVKMLGYTLTESYKTDIIRFASEANLFNGITISDPSAKITYEQASLIMVNALKAPRVASNRNEYTGQKYDTYSPNRLPLLSEKKTGDNLTYGALTDIKYNYSFGGNDAFGYPGTSLVAITKSSIANKDQILGFVPHYTFETSYTQGLNRPVAGPTTLPGTAALEAVQPIEVFENGEAAEYGLDFANASTYVPANGTYAEVVSYTANDGTTKFRTVSVLETLVAQGAYDAEKVFSGATSVGGQKLLTFAAYTPGYALVAYTATATAGPVLSARAVTAEKKNITTIIGSKFTAKDVDGTTTSTYVSAKLADKTVPIAADGFTPFVSVSGLKDTTGIFEVVLGEHGELFYANDPATTWSWATAKYLFVPDQSSAIATAVATNVASTQTVLILEDGTVVKGVIAAAKTATSQHNTLNVVPGVSANLFNTFYEYEIVNGEYALYALTGAIDTTYAYTVTGATAGAVSPGLNPSLGLAQSGTVAGVPLTALTSIKQIGVKTGTPPSAGVTNVKTQTLTGYHKVKTSATGGSYILEVYTPLAPGQYSTRAVWISADAIGHGDITTPAFKATGYALGLPYGNFAWYAEPIYTVGDTTYDIYIYNTTTYAYAKLFNTSDTTFAGKVSGQDNGILAYNETEVQILDATYFVAKIGTITADNVSIFTDIGGPVTYARTTVDSPKIDQTGAQLFLSATPSTLTTINATASDAIATIQATATATAAVIGGYAKAAACPALASATAFKTNTSNVWTAASLNNLADHLILWEPLWTAIESKLNSDATNEAKTAEQTYADAIKFLNAASAEVALNTKNSTDINVARTKLDAFLTGKIAWLDGIS
jgi:hypothetical protein